MSNRAVASDFPLASASPATNFSARKLANNYAFGHEKSFQRQEIPANADLIANIASLLDPSRAIIEISPFSSPVARETGFANVRHLCPVQARNRCVDPNSIGIDIDSFDATDKLLGQAKDHAAIIIVIAALEMARDPRSLMGVLRRCLFDNDEVTLLIGIALSDRGEEPLTEDCIFRRWNMVGFEKFLQSGGFLFSRQSDFLHGSPIFFYSVSCPRSFYRDFLWQHGLAPSATAAPEIALVSTEHARMGQSGGIGTYIDHVSRRSENRPTLVCNPAVLSDEEEEQAERISVVTYRKLFGSAKSSYLDLATRALEMVQQLSFLVSDIEVIESPDYLGLGAHIAQACRAGMLRGNLLTQIYCVGTTLHCEAAGETWGGPKSWTCKLLEDIAIGESERVLFISSWGRDCYLEKYGYAPAHISGVSHPIFFESEQPAQPPSFQACRRLIFFGKQNRLKGFDDFVAALELWTADATEPMPSEIHFIGAPFSVTDDHRRRLANLYWKPKVLFHGYVENSLHALDLVADDAIIVMPYKGEMYPYAYLEVISRELPLVGYAAAGVTELIPEEFRSKLLCPPEPKYLSGILLRSISANPNQLKATARRLKEVVSQRQMRVNSEFFDFHFPKTGSRPSRACLKSPSRVTVCIPFFNMSPAILRETLESVRRQSLVPHEVILADDGSTDFGALAAAEKLMAEMEFQRYRIVHQENRGLAGARNLGLRHCQTEFIATVDADDILCNDFLLRLADALERNPDAVGATSWCQSFRDGTGELLDAWRPVGGRSVIVGQDQNMFGSANSLFRVEHVRAIGGWDDSDKSVFEDWAFWLKCCSRGRKVVLVPEMLYLYRVRSTSLMRTGNLFAGHVRIARSGEALSKLDWWLLQDLVRQRRAEEPDVHLYIEARDWWKGQAEAWEREFQNLLQRRKLRRGAAFLRRKLGWLRQARGDVRGSKRPL